MTEHPILMSAEMILAYQRGAKWQTRRIVKRSIGIAGEIAGAIYPARESGWIAWFPTDEPGLAEFTKRVYSHGFPCPYGALGDRLVFREALRRDGAWTLYDADGAPVEHADAWPWKRDRLPGMFMPRELARYTPLVVAVRVERLQTITPEDVIAEGVRIPAGPDGGLLLEVASPDGPSPLDYLPTRPDDGWSLAALAVAHYAALWDRPNAKRAPWESDPWAWVVEFERVEAHARRTT